MTSLRTPFNKLFEAVATSSSGPPSETQSEISSVNSDSSNLKAIAMVLGVSDPDDLQIERCRIDRQKLEDMITADSNIAGITQADQYFEQLMKSSKTYITWPYKLKLGGKKQPCVKIIGMPNDVQLAKESVLETFLASKVIMKMDVSYTDHSFIIGRAGNNIKRIMEETETHIHFPDSNRSNSTEKSNQVSLNGTIEAVEKARSLVRSASPMLISFELPVFSADRPTFLDSETPFVKEIEAKFSVQVIFSTRPKLHSSLMLIKSAMTNADGVQEAAKHMIFYSYNNLANQISVSMQLEISPQHHDIVRGKNNINLLNIMENTKTKILFPDIYDQNIKPLKKSQVTITGFVQDVYKARQQLMGNLPIALIFDCPESAVDPESVTNLSQKYGVFISLRQKLRQNCKAAVIQGVEKYIDKIYQARHEMLKLESPPIEANIPHSYFSPKDKELETTYCNNLTSLLSSRVQSPLTPGFPLTPTAFQRSQFGNISSSGGSGVAGPAYYQNIKGTPTSICSPNQRFYPIQQQQFQQHMPQTNEANNYLMPPKTLVPPNVSPRNNSSTNTSGYQSFSSSTNSLERGYSSHGSVPSTSVGHYSPDSTFSGDSRNGRRLSDSGVHCGNTSNGYAEAYKTPHYDIKHTFDFDIRRLEGFRAMERSPQGEVRTPNSQWVGLGLSRTTPIQQNVSEDKTEWNRMQGSPFNLAVTTGLVESTGENRRVNLTQHRDLHSLLTSLGLEHYIKNFVLNEIDFDLFPLLTEDDIVELGITAFGARKKLLCAIHTLAAERACNAGPTGSRFSGSAAPGAERRNSQGWL